MSMKEKGFVLVARKPRGKEAKPLHPRIGGIAPVALSQSFLLRLSEVCNGQHHSGIPGASWHFRPAGRRGHGFAQWYRVCGHAADAANRSCHATPKAKAVSPGASQYGAAQAGNKSGCRRRFGTGGQRPRFRCRGCWGRSVPWSGWCLCPVESSPLSPRFDTRGKTLPVAAIYPATKRVPGMARANLVKEEDRHAETVEFSPRLKKQAQGGLNQQLL